MGVVLAALVLVEIRQAIADQHYFFVAIWRVRTVCMSHLLHQMEATVLFFFLEFNLDAFTIRVS